MSSEERKKELNMILEKLREVSKAGLVYSSLHEYKSLYDMHSLGIEMIHTIERDYFDLLRTSNETSNLLFYFCKTQMEGFGKELDEKRSEVDAMVPFAQSVEPPSEGSLHDAKEIRERNKQPTVSSQDEFADLSTIESIIDKLETMVLENIDLTKEMDDFLNDTNFKDLSDDNKFSTISRIGFIVKTEEFIENVNIGLSKLSGMGELSEEEQSRVNQIKEYLDIIKVNFGVVHENFLKLIKWFKEREKLIGIRKSPEFFERLSLLNAELKLRLSGFKRVKGFLKYLKSSDIAIYLLMEYIDEDDSSILSDHRNENQKSASLAAVEDPFDILTRQVHVREIKDIFHEIAVAIEKQHALNDSASTSSLTPVYLRKTYIHYIKMEKYLKRLNELQELLNKKEKSAISSLQSEQEFYLRFLTPSMDDLQAWYSEKQRQKSNKSPSVPTEDWRSDPLIVTQEDGENDTEYIDRVLESLVGTRDSRRINLNIEYITTDYSPNESQQALMDEIIADNIINIEDTGAAGTTSNREMQARRLREIKRAKENRLRIAASREKHNVKGPKVAQTRGTIPKVLTPVSRKGNKSDFLEKPDNIDPAYHDVGIILGRRPNVWRLFQLKRNDSKIYKEVIDKFNSGPEGGNPAKRSQLAIAIQKTLREGTHDKNYTVIEEKNGTSVYYSIKHKNVEFCHLSMHVDASELESYESYAGVPIQFTSDKGWYSPRIGAIHLTAYRKKKSKSDPIERIFERTLLLTPFVWGQLIKGDGLQKDDWRFVVQVMVNPHVANGPTDFQTCINDGFNIGELVVEGLNSVLWETPIIQEKNFTSLYEKMKSFKEAEISQKQLLQTAFESAASFAASYDAESHEDTKEEHKGGTRRMRRRISKRKTRKTKKMMKKQTQRFKLRVNKFTKRKI
jgi:hypothetical protein